MENIDYTELYKLLSIIQDTPMLRVGHFTDSDNSLCKILSQFCQENEYQYIINSTKKKSTLSIQTRYADNNFTSVRNFDLDKKSYLQNGLFYEYLFITTTIPDTQKDTFLKKCYRSIKNSGLIIIFTQEAKSAQQKWHELLEANYYVATSNIELDDKNNVIISKKMHGWGG